MAKEIKIDLKIDSNGGAVIKAIGIDANKLTQAISECVSKSQDLTSSLLRMGSLGSIIQGTSSAISSAAESYNSFDKAMRAANTMAGKSGEDLADLTEKVKELSREIPIAREQLANGLYMAISNGVPENNWLSFLEQSAKASVGGMADLGEAVTVTSTIIKNYALDWSEAGAIQDKIQLTAKNGVTSFEQLAQALPRVSGNAAELGITIDELMAAFATLTGVSGNTAEVSTQLAAVMTALVKPSSEAAKTAEAMGLQFNAAAIKAAGGMGNFLTQLKASVAQYASANGLLEKEVMGKLFGSAESLRALGPLMGNLSATFEQNVASMAGGAGTIDAAYTEMSQTAEAAAQRNANLWASLTDTIGSMASAIQPTVAFTAMIAQSAMGMMVFSRTLLGARAGSSALAVATKGAALATAAFSNQEKAATVLSRAFGISLEAAAAKATALKVALRSALVSTGIGAVLAGLGLLLDKFCFSADKASESVHELDEAEQSMAEASAQATVEIKSEIAKLEVLNKTHGDAKSVVSELNAKYGESFGYYQTAAEWYDVLTRKSKDYALMLGYEAQVRALNARIAKQDVERQLAMDRRTEWERNNKDKRVSLGRDPVTGLTDFTWKGSSEWKSMTADIDAATAKIEADSKALDVAQRRMEETASRSGIKIRAPKVEAPVPVTPVTVTPKAKTKTVKTAAPAPKAEEPVLPLWQITTYAEIERALQHYQKAQQAATGEELKDLQRTIDALQAKRDALEAYATTYNAPMPKDRDSALEDMQRLSRAMGAIKDPLGTGASEMGRLFGQWQALDRYVNSLDAVGSKTPSVTASVGELAGAFGEMGRAVGGAAGQWVQWGASLATAIGAAIPKIAELIAMEKLKSNAQMEDAATGAAASVAAIPIVGWVMAAAAVASVVAALTSLPKFAKGGIAFGPTVGLFGEYQGAATNPEVVAPLDRLTSLMGTGRGKVEFVIKERALYGVLKNAERRLGRI